MSIYSALSIDVPVISYSILHQVKKGVGEKEYGRTIHEMHGMIRDETAKVQKIWNDHIGEITASSIQTSRGNLSQFLTLPLDTDVKEIQRILADQISHLLELTSPVSKVGVITSTEGRFFWERDQNALIQTLWNRGNEYLRKLKFRTKEASQLIFESDFFVETGLNLDILEHIVRDRAGVYETTHGHHIRQADPFVFAAHNLAYLHGTLETGDSKYEAVVHFSKEKTQYAPFRKGLRELLDSVKTGSDIPHCSMWQRKLGLGSGTEFNIRFRATDRRLVREALLLFVKGAEKNPAYTPLVKKGSLLFKELTR